MTTPPGTPPNFHPAKTFKLVYLIILAFTLIGLVHQLAGTATLGFMTMIDGEANASVGRGVMLAMFGSWALFIFSTYLHVEAFEDSAKPFHNIVRPINNAIVFCEWLVRFTLVCLVTVKFWTPESYQNALLLLSGICSLLFLWTLLVSFGFNCKWRHTDFGLLAVAAMSSFVAWLSGNPIREAEWGLAVFGGLAILFLVTVTLACIRLFGAVPSAISELV